MQIFISNYGQAPALEVSIFKISRAQSYLTVA